MILAEYGLDHAHVLDRWTMAQMRAYVQRRNERIRRERAAHGGDGGRAVYTGRTVGGQPVKESGLAEFCIAEKRRGKVKRLPTKSERLKAAGMGGVTDPGMSDADLN